MASTWTTRKFARAIGISRNDIEIREKWLRRNGMTTATETIRAPRGSKLRCKGWQQEGALRCLMNNLDPEFAERPSDLVVYGGIGKAARNWDCFHAIVRELENLG